MGSYLNIGSGEFQECVSSEIYVDKSMIIQMCNACIGTMQKYICVSRPRRFGKSMVLKMLAAYYGKSEDSSHLFRGLKITDTESYRKHLNKYDVIVLNMQEFLSRSGSIDEMLSKIQRFLMIELKREYPGILFLDDNDLIQVMKDIYVSEGRRFIILIDEWDCLFREYQQDSGSQKRYLDFLRVWLKDQAYVAMAYMTGILPIKKYGTHSALNMFREYSMTNPGELAEFFGFTADEVEELCKKYDMDYEETRNWYDGYCFNIQGEEQISVYNPKSVVEAMLNRSFQNYWNKTETYEALKTYIEMNYDGLKEDILRMLVGAGTKIETGTFSNDMTTFTSKHDVLTLLVHLGYLRYDLNTGMVSIPNKEVSQEYINAITGIGWKEVVESVENSRGLLQALWKKDAEKVAEGIEKVHREVSILQYNDENALSYTVSLAFYSAREYYTIVRELPTGEGFADICFIPRKRYIDKPAVVIELKYNKSAGGAIAQIKNKKYVETLDEYKGNLLLVGINYDKATKKHQCLIEEWSK